MERGQALCHSKYLQLVALSLPKCADIEMPYVTCVGVVPVDLAGLLNSTTAVTATLSGTNAGQWTTSNNTLPLASLTGSRKLQQQQQDMSVSLAIVTTNPQLVVFRLTQTPLPSSAAAVQASSPAAGSSSVQGNCKTEYCLRLAAAGIPVDAAFGVKVTPVFDFSTSSSNADTAAAAIAARDAELARSKTVGVAVGVSVAVAVVVLILLCNARRIIACWHNRAAAKLKATDKDSAAADSRNRWLLLSWSGAAAAPTSKSEGGAAAATVGAAGSKNPATATLSSSSAKKVPPANWLARLSVGSGASQSSSTIGTVPMTAAVPTKHRQVPEHEQQETVDVASYWDDQHEDSSNSGRSNSQKGNRIMRSVFSRSGSFRGQTSQSGAVSDANAQSAAASEAGAVSVPSGTIRQQSVGHSQAATALAAGDNWYDCKSDPGSDDHV